MNDSIPLKGGISREDVRTASNRSRGGGADSSVLAGDASADRRPRRSVVRTPMPTGLKHVDAIDVEAPINVSLGPYQNACINVIEDGSGADSLAARINFEKQMVVTYKSRAMAMTTGRSLGVKTAGLASDGVLHLSAAPTSRSCVESALAPREAAFAVPRHEGGIELHVELAGEQHRWPEDIKLSLDENLGEAVRFGVSGLPPDHPAVRNVIESQLRLARSIKELEDGQSFRSDDTR